MRPIALAVLACLGFGCTGPVGESVQSDGTWVGTITTEGDVTTVINESGSVWEGTARLVEEASIGSETAGEEYLFSYIMSVSSNGEHIFVVDEQTDIVRRYDHDGRYIDTIGGNGQGPGEYQDPRVAAVAPDGRIFVYDSRGSRILVYAADGGTLDTWVATGVACCAWGMVFNADGTPWLPTRERREDSLVGPRYGIREYGPEGGVGDIVHLVEMEAAKRTLSVGGRTVAIPLVPRFIWDPAGPASFVAGVGNEYRFEVQRGGRKVLEVHKYWQPVPVDPDHAEWDRRLTVARARRFEPGWNWDGAEIPDHLPAYADFIVTDDGDIWVTRFGRSVRRTDCVEDSLAADDGGSSAAQNGCWRDLWILDAFGPDGRFLGEIETPPRMAPFSLYTHVVGNRVIGVETDEWGTPSVKRYRLVMPGEEGQ